MLCGVTQFLGTEINVQSYAQTIFLNFRKETMEIFGLFFLSVDVENYVFAFDSLPL